MKGTESPCDSRSKRELRREYRASNAWKKDERRKHRRCFWTWPFGHLWGGTDRYWWVCQCCEKRTKGPVIRRAA